MKKIILLSAVLATSLLAETTMEVIKDAAVSEAKSEVRKAVLEEVSGSSEVIKDAAVSEAKSEVRKAVAEEVSDSSNAVKNITEEVRSAVEDTNNSASEISSLKDKAVDMALEKVVGSDTMKKEVVKEVIDSAMN